MNTLTAFGLFAVIAMLVTYALEERHRGFILAFAGSEATLMFDLDQFIADLRAALAERSRQALTPGTCVSANIWAEICSAAWCATLRHLPIA